MAVDVDRRQAPVAALPRLLTGEEAADYLRVSPYTVDRERLAGRLEGVRVRGRWRYRIDKLAAYVEAQAGTGCPTKKKPGSSSEPTGSDSAKDPGSGIDSGSIQTLDRRAALASAQAIFNRPAKP